MIPFPTLGLVHKLCKMLETEGIVYCHWKSNAALERSAAGDNDLDLLVDRGSAQRFTEILFRCGFKEAQAPPRCRIPGILDYYGYDAEQSKLVHVHVHYLLILGDDATKNYRLPIEKPFLASSSQGELFRIPAPEFEYVVFVVRMALKHSTWSALLRRQTSLSAVEQQELAYLHAQINNDQVYRILVEHMPYLDVQGIEAYIRSLLDGSNWSRLKAGQRLQNSLEACARRTLIADEWLKLWRYCLGGMQRRIFKQTPCKQLANGGVIVAVVGGDGAGKSTAVDSVYAWLSKCFKVRTVHLGKPAWSFLTIMVRGFLKIGTVLGLYPFSTQETTDPDSTDFPGYPTLIRSVCVARDRRLTYKRARRFASNGGIVICDRFPLPRIMVVDGPQVERWTRNVKRNWFIKLLIKMEEKNYQRILPPDLLTVLRLDPETAVQRKADESESSVRARTQEVWGLDWNKTHAHVIDASQPRSKVLSDLKGLIWSNL